MLYRVVMLVALNIVFTAATLAYIERAPAGDKVGYVVKFLKDLILSADYGTANDRVQGMIKNSPSESLDMFIEPTKSQ